VPSPFRSRVETEITAILCTIVQRFLPRSRPPAHRDDTMVVIGRVLTTLRQIPRVYFPCRTFSRTRNRRRENFIRLHPRTLGISLSSSASMRVTPPLISWMQYGRTILHYPTPNSDLTKKDRKRKIEAKMRKPTSLFYRRRSQRIKFFFKN